MRRETLCPVVGALVLAAVAAACGSDGDGRTSGARPSADAGADAAVDQSADVGDGSGGDAGASGAGGQGSAAGTGGNGGIGAAGASGTAGTGGAGAAGSSGSAPIDLRSYFPDTQVTKTYRHDDGSLYSTYTYFPATPSFSSVYETFFTLQKPGRLHVWAKGYGDAGCIATYAHLFLGDDLSFTEVGDYLANDGCNPSVVFGYGSATSPANDGLAWSAPGGLPAPNGVGETAEKYGLLIKRQNNAGDAYLTTSSKAWNRTVIVEVLPSFRPAYGRSPQGEWGEGFGKDYANVVRIVFYHGTQVPNQDDIAPCTVDPTWPYASYYYSLPDYHSYGSEYYLAEGEWIIQEAFLYTEDGSYWGIPNCVGLALDKNPAWVSYVDGG